jgi:hypothetical protein
MLLGVHDKIKNGEIPLHKASRLMYEKLQGSVIAGIAEREGKTPNGILEWFGNHLVLQCPISAQRLPSTTQLELSEDERRYLKVIDGGSTIVSSFGDPVKYVNPKIRRGEVGRATEILNEMGKPFQC